MATFHIVHSDEYLTEAKSYTIENALKYGIEKAIIMNTLGLLEKFKMEDIIKYFPEFEDAAIKKHLEELMTLGIIK